MPAQIHISVSEKLCRRDPLQTQLGRRLLYESVKLIHEMGMEVFTFRKLAQAISSTEASIYRYFLSKQQLLNYLFAWYWGWLEYRLSSRTANISDPRLRLKAAIGVLAELVEDDPNIPHVNEALLHKIVVTESDRSLLTRNMRSGRGETTLEAYESLCRTLSCMIRKVNPRFAYPQALTVTLLAVTHRQRFYAEYFPDITEVRMGRDDPRNLAGFLETLAFSVLQGSPK